MSERNMAGKIVKRMNGVPWQIVGEGAVILQTRQSKVHELNETGSWIWKNLDGISTLETLAFTMGEEFEVPREEALKDIETFIGDLEGQGLIQWI